MSDEKATQPDLFDGERYFVSVQHPERGRTRYWVQDRDRWIEPFEMYACKGMFWDPDKANARARKLEAAHQRAIRPQLELL